MKNRCLVALFVALALAPAVWANTSDANGMVKDRDGNPVEGVVVRFRPKGNPSKSYEGKTNKKGRYFATGLWTPVEGDRWEVLVEGAGLVPVHVRVESRNASKVLVGAVLETKLSFGQKIPEISIRPLGSAQVDIVVAPEDVVRQEALAAQQGSAAASAAPGQAPAAAQPAADPWEEAVALARSGDLESSLPLFEKAAAQGTDSPERFEAYAQVLYQLERFDDAVAQATRAVEIAPDRLQSHMVLYSALVGKGDLAGAAKRLAAAAELAPDDIRVLEQRAFIASELGNDAEFIAANERITTVAPDNGGAWFALGGAYAKAGDMAKSEQAYQRVAELDPERSHQTFYNLGVLMMNRSSGSPEETQRAVDAFRKAVQIKPDYAQAHQQLAYALLGVDDRAGARAALETYLRLAPKAPDAEQMRRLIATLGK